MAWWLAVNVPYRELKDCPVKIRLLAAVSKGLLRR
jgi:hypothetical protein